MMSASEIIEAAKRIKLATSTLHQMTDDEIVGALARVFDVWRDPSSPGRRELQAKLPSASGFSEESVQIGTQLGFAPWTGESFRKLVDAELGPADANGRRSVRGYELTSVLLAGSIPMPSLLSVVLPLVLRSPVLCKPASRDLITPALIADSIRAIAPRLADCVAITPFDKNDSEASRAFYASACISATGSNETIAQVNRQLSSAQGRLTYDHRVSIAVIENTPGSHNGQAKRVDALALDIALWDQLGCLSPVSSYLVGGDRNENERFAAELARALERAQTQWPRGVVSTEAAAMIARERSEAEMRCALGRNTQLLASKGSTQWTVVLEDDHEQRPAPLHRFIRLHSVADIDALPNALTPLAPHLAGVALSGFGTDHDSLAQRLLALGASRVCALGELQTPPIDWPRDNQPLLQGLVASDHSS